MKKDSFQCLKPLFNKRKLKVKTGDVVKILAGNYRGSEGKILRILQEKNRVVVEGVQMILKHKKPTSSQDSGSIIKTEGSVHISNVQVVKKFVRESINNNN